MGSAKHDPRAYPRTGDGNERETRKLFEVFDRLHREGQDDIVAACYQAIVAGRNPFDAAAEALQLLSRDRLFVRRQLARYLECNAVPTMLVLRANGEPEVKAPTWTMTEDQAIAAALAHPEPGSGAEYLARVRPEPPPGPCRDSPGERHQLVVRGHGELVVIECGVCRALSPDSD